MTKKDYVLIARAIKAWADFHQPKRDQLRDLVVGFSIELKDTNPLFDSKKFIEACGLVD